MWSFVYTLCNDALISARLGEKSSVTVSIARNANRSLELTERRTRKAAGAKVDILFRHGYDELGCCEMGKDKVTPVDDKYIDDGYIKLTKTFRDILSSLTSQNPAQKHNMIAVGYLMMGVKMELVLADAPAGDLICRVLRTERQEFPQSIDTFFVDFIPLLEAAWMGKELMKNSIHALTMRKRKSVALATVEDTSPYTPSTKNPRHHHHHLIVN